MDDDDKICLTWLLFCTPVPMGIALGIGMLMFTLGLDVNSYLFTICFFVIRALFCIWIFVFMATCFMAMYGIATMDRINMPINSVVYKRIDVVTGIIIITVLLISTYYIYIENVT